MPTEVEMEQSITASIEAPARSEAPIETPAPAASTEKSPEAAPEPSLREKIAQKAAEVAEKREKKAEKAPKVDPIAAKTPTPNEGEKAPKVAPVADKTVVPAAFQPNYKLKVMEKEQEIPEWLRPLMKDADSEKQVREFAEKALGIDFIKPKLEQARTQLTHVSQERDQVMGQIAEVKQLYARGDLDGFFKKLNIPEERILQWITDKINYNQLPQEQKEILDSRKHAEERAFSEETRANTLQKQHETFLSQQVQMALDTELARPDVKAVAEAFEARMGKPGSFLAEVRRRGDYAWKTQGVLVPPNQLVQELMAFLGPVAPPAAVNTPVTPTATAAPSQPNQGQRQPTPTIPNISGRPTSAIQSKVKSLDDIKKRYKELQAEG